MSEEKLASADVIKDLRGRDKRPLLIIRDSEVAPSKKASKLDGYLSAALESERFILASQWFNCIKLAPNVIEEGHPYNSLFAGKNPPRMILSTWDGSKRIAMLGKGQAKVTWSKISKLLKLEYKKDATRAVKELQKLLNHYDSLDQREAELREQIEKGKTSGRLARVKSLEKKLAAQTRRREEIAKLELDLKDLVLKRGLAAKKALKKKARAKKGFPQN